MPRPAVKTGSGATVKMQMPAAGRFCPTHLHCISDPHKMYLQIRFVSVTSPLFVFVFALVFLMLCCAGKYSTAGAACAPHARAPTTAAARGKNSTPATRLNFAQKIGSSLEMGLSVGPILAKFCATGTKVRFP